MGRSWRRRPSHRFPPFSGSWASPTRNSKIIGTALSLQDFHFRPLTKFTPYLPGQLFQLGEVILEIIPAPGHTPGHSCFHFPRQRLLFLADVDLTPFGPWYGDATSNLETFEATLNDLQHFRAQTYFTSHGQGLFTESEFQAGLTAFHQKISEREARLLEALGTPQSLDRLSSPAYDL